MNIMAAFFVLKEKGVKRAKMPKSEPEFEASNKCGRN